MQEKAPEVYFVSDAQMPSGHLAQEPAAKSSTSCALMKQEARPVVQHSSASHGV